MRVPTDQPDARLLDQRSTSDACPSDEHEEMAKTTCSRRQQWVAFFILGTFNNFAYVLILSCAKSLAESFEAENLIGVIQWANVGVGVFSKGLNTFFFMSSSYRMRVAAVSAVFVAGHIALAVSTYVNFWFAIVAIAIIGGASSFGESVMVCYLKECNPNLMSAWGSGTGMAGVAGTLAYVLLHSILRLSNMTVFLLVTPTMIIYWITFALLNRGRSSTPVIISTTSTRTLNHSAYRSVQPKSPNVVTNQNGTRPTRTKSIEEIVISRTQSKNGFSSLHSEKDTPNEADTRRTNEDEEDEETRRPVLSLGPRERVGESSSNGRESELPESDDVLNPRQIHVQPGQNSPDSTGLPDYDLEPKRAQAYRVMMATLYYSTQLAAVYFFEYVASVGAAAKSNKQPGGNWWSENAYEILAFCYQLGVLISRSSISFVKIRRIELMTIIQGFNFLIWTLHAWKPFLPLWLQFPVMVFVGLLGGAMYVNVFYFLCSDTKIRPQDQDLAINITSMFINVGIIASSLFTIAMDNTILKD